MSFLQRLRDLDARATPGPWEWRSNSDGYPTELEALGVGVLRPGIAVSPGDGGLSAYITNDSGSAETDHPDFALIVTLRNHAARLAAVVEAGKALVDETNARYPNRDEWPKQYLDLRAALTALDTEPT